MRADALARLPNLRRAFPQEFRAITPGRVAAVMLWLFGTVLLGIGIWRLGIEPARVLTGFGQFLHYVSLMFPPDPGTEARAWGIVRALGETLGIAFLGTLLAATLALPIGFLAARNTTINGLVRFAARRVLDGIRGVDALIWALIWVSVVGLGPFAGMLAIMVSDTGTFGKVFSEIIESADRRADEGVVASGGSGAQRVRFGTVPQVLPEMAGQVLYFFESNVRSSTIIGIVGAGGIGLHLAEMIRTLEWEAVSFIILLILVMVAIIDFISGRLRQAIAGAREQAAD